MHHDRQNFRSTNYRLVIRSICTIFHDRDSVVRHTKMSILRSSYDTLPATKIYGNYPCPLKKFVAKSLCPFVCGHYPVINSDFDVILAITEPANRDW